MTDRDRVARIAETVLYEGYLLWPYRRSALKNQRRWTFGAVFPPAWTARHPDDPATMRTECLLQDDGEPDVEVTVRFLQVVEHRGGWEEATEREVIASAIPQRRPIDVAAGSADERSWSALVGEVAAATQRLAPDLHRLTVTVANTSAWDGEARDDALRRAFVSTHTILRARRGAFVSLMDPPEGLRDAAAACHSEGTYPVLAGEPGDRGTVLSSPIVLYDHPEVAPESPGDLFDATEIDQLLVLSVLALSEEEQREVRASDPRARELLDRCAGLSPEELLRLNGAVRELRVRDAP